MNESTPSPQVLKPLSSADHDAAASVDACSSLRLARERAGLHPQALAALLKVPVHRLEALEAGRFEELPDMTFARALALSICRLLKVDPQPIMASFPASSETSLVDADRGINHPIPKKPWSLGGTTSVVLAPGLSWPVWFALLLAVLAILLWIFLPSWKATPSTEASAPLPIVTVPIAPDPVAGEGHTASLPSATDMPDQAASPLVSDGQIAHAAQGSIAAADPPQPAATSVPAKAFTMNARQTAWVQVTGASGKVLLQRTLQSGEQVVFGDDFPLSVVVGRADAVDVSLRGQPLDMSPHARNNVARFEVR